jgi:hypothetical protein
MSTKNMNKALDRAIGALQEADEQAPTYDFDDLQFADAILKVQEMVEQLRNGRNPFDGKK